MKNEEAIYWYWICNIAGIGRKTIAKLLEQYQSPEVIYQLPQKELESLLTAKQVQALLHSKNKEHLQREYAALAQQGIRFFYPKHEKYPKRLLQLYDYPYGIYVKGTLPEQNMVTVAIVGSRNATFYGRDMACYFGRELAKAGIGVISGLAYGVDGQAHKGALQAQAYTLGIMGCGINICYPKENYNIYRMMEKQGGILSENGLHVTPHPGLFPLRNRLIAAMADGIFVVEAQKKSGSLITVDQGLELGRDIFALPGRNTDAHSRGCNNLIKSGAKLVENPMDIMEEYQNRLKMKMSFPEEKKKLLVKNEKMVYSNLSLEPKFIDTIIEETGMQFSQISSVLLSLEMKGYVKQSGNGYYSINI